MELTQEICCAIFLCLLTSAQICASTSAERKFQNEQITTVIRLPENVREKNVEAEPEYVTLNSEASSEIINRSVGDDAHSSESAVINRFANAPDSRDQYSASPYNPEAISGNNYSPADNDPPGPEDHVIPYSEHEEPREISTKPKYRAPGEWAKPPPEKNVPLDFVPTKHYAQVRGTHTVKRLPKEEAIKSAETKEEIENAPRLREVVTNSKVNTVYTEEGYEDSAYDHAGHIRDADFHEGFAKKLHEEIDSKQDSDNGKYRKKKKERSREGRKKTDTSVFNNYDDDYSDHLEESLKVEEKIPVSKAGSDVNNEDANGVWGDPDINPKTVVLNGVKKLEDDLEREAAEVERGSEIHDSVKLHETEDDSVQNYNEAGTSELDNHRRNYDRVNEDDRSVITETTERNLSVRRKSLDNKNKNGKTSETGIKEVRRPEGYKNKYETTPTPSSAYVAPTTTKFYETTAELKRISPPYSTEFQNFPVNNRKEAASRHVPVSEAHYSNERPTTVDYGRLFWNYFKVRGNEQGPIPGPIQIQETTTLGPEIEGSTPLAVATINGHGPYLLVTNDQVTTIPTTSITLRSYDLQKLASTSEKMADDDSGKVQVEAKQGENNGLIDTPKFAAYENFQPQSSFFDSYQAWATEPAFSANNFEDVAYSSTTTDSVTVQSKDNLKTQMEEDDNPFFSPLVRDSYESLVNRNKSRYRVLVRHEPIKHHKYHKAGIKPKQNTTGDNLPKKNESRKPQNYSEIRDKLEDNSFYKNPVEKVVYKNVNLLPNQANPQEYRKMLDYIKDQQSSGKQGNEFLSGDGESSFKDFTIMRPPAIPQQADEVTYSGFLPHHPRGNPAIVERPSVSTESDTPRERNTKNLPASFDWHRVRAHKLAAPPLIPITRPTILQPLGLIHKRTLIPPTELLPPPPASYQMDHLKYNVDGLNEHYVLGNDHLNQQKEHQGSSGLIKKFIPITFELPWSIDAGKRQKRSADIASENKINPSSTVVDEKETLSPTNDRDAKNDTSTIRGTVKRKRNSTSEKASNIGNGQIIATFESKRIARKLNDPPTTASDNNQGHFKSNITDSAAAKFSETKVAKLDGPTIENMNEIQNPNTVSRKKNSTKRVVARRAPPLLSKSKKRRLRKTEDELLNESPKITEDVINEELRSRFDEDANKKKVDEEERGHVEIEVPEFDYAEESVEGKSKETVAKTSTEPNVDTKKYPFYKSRKIPDTAALKYIINPAIIPKKTFGGMEFYESRDAYKRCSEVEPNLDEVLPEEEEPVPDRGLKENLPRLQGLGNKIDCFKAKFFDENPFDNPLFFEKRVDEPSPPPELDPEKFKSRILEFPKEKDDYIVQMISKRPESENSLQQLKFANGPHPETLQLNYRYGPRDKNNQIGYFHSVRQSLPTRPEKRQKRKNQRPNIKPIFITTESPTYLSFTPYQNLVYEDVMGNIQNSEHSYRILPKAIKSPTTHARGLAVKSKTPHNIPNLERERDTGVPLVDITERPRIYSSSAESFHPSPYMPSSTQPKFHKRPPSYRPTSVQIFPSNPRAIRRLKRIVLQNRNVRGKNETNKVKHTITRRSIQDSIPGEKLESKIKGITKETELSLSQSTVDNNYSTTTKPMYRTKPEKMQNANISTNLSNEPKAESSQKVVYTIRDRIKHSKPREIVTKVGKFTADESSTDVETRRREPKYNKIANKRLRANSTSFTSAYNELDKSTDATSPEPDGTPVTSATSTLIERKQLPDSLGLNVTRRKKKANNVTTDILESEITVTPSIGNDDSIKSESTNTSERTLNAYDVHEDVREDVATTTLTSVPTTSDEFARLKAYLESDPPGYAEAFPEESNKKFKVNDSDESKRSDIKFRNESEEKEKSKEEANENKEKEKKKVTSSESVERSASDERSTEREDEEKSPAEVTRDKEEEPEMPRDEKSSKEDKSSSKSSEKSSKEDKPFSRFIDRPFSPPESFEDAKYSDLGPRVNKPPFYHPPFSVPDYERYREKTGKDKWISSDEKDENGKYIFPWNREKIRDNDSEELKHRSLESYEYPWEKRERLAKEQKRRKRKYGFFDDDDDDEEDNVSFVKKRNKYVYPWDRYNTPSRYRGNSKRHVWRSSSFDNDELSSENLPVVKHDTRYHDNNRKTSLETDLDVDLIQDSDKIETSPITSLTDNNSKRVSSKDSNFKSSFDVPDSTKVDSILSLDPDDVTPNKKSRRKMMQIEKSASYEIISESMEEPDRKKLTKKKSIKKLSKRRNKNILDDPETKAREITTQSPTSTTTITKLVDSSGPSTRKHRKRKVVKIHSIDKPATEAVTVSTTEPTPTLTTESIKPGRRRVRFSPQISTASTTTPATRHVRRKQQVTNSLNKKNPPSEIWGESDVSVNDNSKDTAPAARTIEHRSKVSKEKIITKTVYPNDEAAFDVGRQRKSVGSQSRKYSTGSTAKANNSEARSRRKTDEDKPKRTTKNKNVEKISTIMKKTPDKVYRDKEIDKKELKGRSVTSIINNKTEVHTSKENLNDKDAKLQDMRKLKMLDDLNTSHQNASNESESVPSSESYIIGSLMQNATPSITDNSKSKETNSNESDESDESEEEADERKRILSRARVIKDPQRRLYYYVDRR